MFEKDALDEAIMAAGIAPDPTALQPGFDALLEDVLTQATLQKPGSDFAHKGGKSGQRHSEHLGHILAQMQWLQRAYPEATW